MSSRNYKAMTRYELEQLARQRGIAGFSHARKSQLVYALENGLYHVEGPGYGSGRRSYNREQEMANTGFSGPGNFQKYTGNEYGRVGGYRNQGYSSSNNNVGYSRNNYGGYGSRDRYGDYNNVGYTRNNYDGAYVGHGRYSGSYGSRERY